MSCLALSACGGGFFLDDEYDVQKPTIDEVNAINQNVTMLPTQLEDGTDISDVTFIDIAYTEYGFDVDSNKLIKGFVRKFDNKHYTRENNNTNVFIDDEKDTRYRFESFDENHVLQYSDFGLFDREDDFQNDMLFVGGYDSKRIDKPTDLYDGSVFVGSAVARVKRSENDGIIAKTNDAVLEFNKGAYTLTMPFNKANAGGAEYYDVTYYSDNSKLTFDGGYKGDYKWEGDNGSGTSLPCGYGSGPMAYGENGVTREIVGFIGANGTDTNGSDMRFEAAYGLTRK